jgi:hypothetical protein
MLQGKLTAVGPLLVLGLALGGCHEPLPYSPNYSRITLVDEAAVPAKAAAYHKAAGDKGYAPTRVVRQAKTVVAPDACLTPDVNEQPLYLPPGCANNLNLQMMVERPSDLAHGRRPGPAAAAPAAHAAQRYLYGATEAERKSGKTEQQRDQPTAPSLPQGTRTDVR